MKIPNDNRIRFFDHEGKRILLVDLSHCTACEVEEITRKVPDYVTAEPPRSVLILTNFAGSSFDADALRAIKETAVFDKPFVKKSALIGTARLPREFHNEMQSFSRRDLPIFTSRADALRWLVTGGEPEQVQFRSPALRFVGTFSKPCETRGTWEFSL